MKITDGAPTRSSAAHVLASIRAISVLVAQRSLARPWLLAIRFAGALIAVMLVAGVSLYSAAMGDAMLQASLRTDSGSPYIAVTLSNGTVSTPEYRALDTYIRRRLSSDLGLPLQLVQVYHSSASVNLYRVRSGSTALAGNVVAAAAINYDEALAGHATLTAGTFQPPAAASGDVAAVTLMRDTARRLHLHVGDRVAFSANGTRAILPILEIAGTFVPIAPNDSYWSIGSQGSVPNVLVTTQIQTFQRFAARGLLFNPSYFWLQQTSLRSVHLADANALLDRLNRTNSKIAAIAPGASLLEGLSLDINGFNYQYDLLPTILLILVGPIIILVLYAIAVTTALVLDRQTGEVLLMRGRGATSLQVFTMYLLEGLLIAAGALLIGPPLGLALANLIAHASGFLTFSGGLPMELRLTQQVYLVSVATVIAALMVGLVPATGLAQRSLLSFRVQQARRGRRPLGQRLFLDLIAFVIAIYGLIQLHAQGPVTSGAATAVVANDPLVALAPLLFSIAAALLIGRILPRLAAIVHQLLARISSPSVFIALQSLARSPRQSMRLVQLCTLTLTLGVFAATVAGIESYNAVDQQSYEAGATIRMTAFPDRVNGTGRIRPLAEYLALPGVRAVMPALRFETTGNVSNMTSDGTSVNVLGIDPARAAQVIWFRPDFADTPLTQLLALISTRQPTAIVSDSFVTATGLHRGDSLDVVLTNDRRISVRIVATTHYFPTLDPKAYPFVITNLAYLEQASNAGAANEIWIAANPQRDAVNRVVEGIRAWRAPMITYEGMPPVTDAGTDPLRVGIYGVVSIGFLIAVGLVLLGFITYAFLSLQQRLTEFAILRSLGLSPAGMRALLFYEQAFLLGAAMIGGIAAGIVTTQLYLPYLPIATRTLPPFLVVTPWGSIAAFVLALFVLFLLVVSALVLLVLRLPLGRVLRLGDT